MKALTISQPFASLIADGEKFVENRKWETPYRGPLAIHAGKGTQYLDRDELANYPTGCIIAVAQLVACVSLTKIQDCDRDTDRRKRIIALGTTKNWSELARHAHTEGPFCWVLEEVRKLDQPIPCRGAQGLWEPNAVQWHINVALENYRGGKVDMAGELIEEDGT